MFRMHANSKFAANLVLALLLVSAQSAALAHAYEHEMGSPQSQACASCVTAGQLAGASVDNPAATELDAFHSILNGNVESTLQAIAHLVVRQRGPPCSV